MPIHFSCSLFLFFLFQQPLHKTGGPCIPLLAASIWHTTTSSAFTPPPPSAFVPPRPPCPSHPSSSSHASPLFLPQTCVQTAVCNCSTSKTSTKLHANAMVVPLLMQVCKGVLQEDTAVTMASMGGVDTNVGGGGGFVFLGFQQRGGGGGPCMVPFTILTGSMGSHSVHVNGVLPSFGVGPTHVVKEFLGVQQRGGGGGGGGRRQTEVVVVA